MTPFEVRIDGKLAVIDMGSGAFAEAGGSDLMGAVPRILESIAGVGGIALDATRIRFMSSSGVGSLVFLCTEIEDEFDRSGSRAPQIMLITQDPNVKRTITLAGVDELFEVVDTVEIAKIRSSAHEPSRIALRGAPDSPAGSPGDGKGAGA